MKKRKKHIYKIKLHELVELDRSFKEIAMVEGFVIAISEDFILLNSLDPNIFHLNGYTLIRKGDVKRFRTPPSKNIKFKGLSLRRQKVKYLPEISIDNYPCFFSSVKNIYPLVAIHRERIAGDQCSIGKILNITNKTVTLSRIGLNGRRLKPKRFRYHDITRVDFEGSYEKALWLVAQSIKEKSNRKLV